MSFLYSIVSFCVMLGIIIAVHELGHYLTARWCGVAVETFSIGFGHPVAGWYDRSGTLWKIGWIPLGGYVKMYNLDSHKLVSRILVVIAGPIANVLLALVIITSVFLFVGVPVNKPIIGYVAADTPAERAGLLPRDLIVTFDNIPITSFTELSTIVSDRPGKTVAITVERDGMREQVQATLGSNAGYGLLGIMPANEMSPTQALIDGPLLTERMIEATVGGLLHISVGNLSGPVGIAHASGEAAQQGLIMWLWLVTSLSISLAVFNMIPLPVMDGGHLLYYLIEAMLGRPLPQVVQEIGMVTSSLLLFGLFLFVTWHDITRWLFG